MTLLTVIWVSAVAFGAAALLWITSLVLLRLAHEGRSGRRAAIRREIEAAFVGAMQGLPGVGERLAPYVGRAPLMAEVVLEFLALVRGQDRERVLAVLRELEIDAGLRANLRRGPLAGRLACIDALAAFPDPATAQALAAAAADGGPRERLGALRALAAVGGAIALDAVLDDAKAGRLRLSGMLADFLRTLCEADPPAAIAACGRRDLPPALQAMLLRALGEAGDYGALPALTGFAAASDPAVRTAAVEALGRLRHPAAEAALGAALSDDHWQVRAAASEAAGAGRLARLAPLLTERLADPVWQVRFQAAGALREFGAHGLELLERAAEGPVETASRAASFAIAERVA